jgi:hypothetical protein
MNTSLFDVALKMVEDDLRDDWQIGTDMPSGQKQGREVDVWRHIAKHSSDNGASKSSVQLRLMADDGNFLVALFVCSIGGRANDELTWDEAVRDLQVEGYRMRRTTLDAGIHRLVVQMILPDDDEFHLALSSRLAASKEGAGQFRTVLLPPASHVDSDFRQAYARRRAAIGPLPCNQFLHPIDETDLAELVGDVLDKVAGPFQESVGEDLATFLRKGDWEAGSNWPCTREKLDAYAQEPSSPEGVV